MGLSAVLEHASAISVGRAGLVAHCLGNDFPRVLGRGFVAYEGRIWRNLAKARERLVVVVMGTRIRSPADCSSASIAARMSPSSSIVNTVAASMKVMRDRRPLRAM